MNDHKQEEQFIEKEVSTKKEYEQKDISEQDQEKVPVNSSKEELHEFVANSTQGAVNQLREANEKIVTDLLAKHSV